MQHRMEAGLRKYVKDDVLIINYAAYSAKVLHNGAELVYEDEPHGMWNMERYPRRQLSLLFPQKTNGKSRRVTGIHEYEGDRHRHPCRL